MADTTQDRETLITLTSDIVAAHVSNNNVAVDQVSGLIANVYEALAGLGAEPVAAEAPREPAVSIRASVKPDHVTCLECGKQMKMLKRHLATDHGLSVDEYRQRWGLAASHPLVAPNYAATRADLAKKIGLGRGGRGGRGAAKAAAAAPEAKAPAAKASVAKATPAPKAKADAKPKGGRKLGLKFKGAAAETAE